MSVKLCQNGKRSYLLAGDVVDSVLETLEVSLINGTGDATGSHSLHAETDTEGVHTSASEGLP